MPRQEHETRTLSLLAHKQPWKPSYQHYEDHSIEMSNLEVGLGSIRRDQKKLIRDVKT